MAFSEYKTITTTRNNKTDSNRAICCSFRPGNSIHKMAMRILQCRCTWQMHMNAAARKEQQQQQPIHTINKCRIIAVAVCCCWHLCCLIFAILFGWTQQNEVENKWCCIVVSMDIWHKTSTRKRNKKKQKTSTRTDAIYESMKLRMKRVKTKTKTQPNEQCTNKSASLIFSTHVHFVLR